MEEEGTGFWGSTIRKLESIHNADRHGHSSRHMNTDPQRNKQKHLKTREETKSLTGKQLFQVDLTILLHSFKFLVPLLIIPFYISSARSSYHKVRYNSKWKELLFTP